MRRSVRAITTTSLLAALLATTGCFKMDRHQLAGGNSPAVIPPVDGGGGGDSPPPTDAGNDGGGGGGGDSGDGGGGGVQPPVPEPATLALLGSGLAGLALMRRRKRANG